MKWILPLVTCVLLSLLIPTAGYSAAPPPAPSGCSGGRCNSPTVYVQRSVQTTRQVIVVTPKRVETRQRVSRREVRRGLR